MKMLMNQAITCTDMGDDNTPLDAEAETLV